MKSENAKKIEDQIKKFNADEKMMQLFLESIYNSSEDEVEFYSGIGSCQSFNFAASQSMNIVDLKCFDNKMAVLIDKKFVVQKYADERERRFTPENFSMQSIYFVFEAAELFCTYHNLADMYSVPRRTIGQWKKLRKYLEENKFHEIIQMDTHITPSTGTDYGKMNEPQFDLGGKMIGITILLRNKKEDVWFGPENKFRLKPDLEKRYWKRLF